MEKQQLPFDKNLGFFLVKLACQASDRASKAEEDRKELLRTKADPSLIRCCERQIAQDTAIIQLSMMLSRETLDKPPGLFTRIWRWCFDKR